MAPAVAHAIAAALLPPRILGWVREKRRTAVAGPAPGRVRYGDLRRLQPLSRDFGYDRGRPIDRYYIENFLAAQAGVIAGRVLEVGDNTYTSRFGGPLVAQSEVLHVTGNTHATVVGNLADPHTLPRDTFDCVILTQTLQFVFDVRAAVTSIHHMLKAGGVALVTLPGISQIDRGDAQRWGEWWRFTRWSAERLFTDVFPEDAVLVQGHGNVLAAAGFLYGLAAEELRSEELDYRDTDYDLVITVRAQKPSPGR